MTNLDAYWPPPLVDDMVEERKPRRHRHAWTRIEGVSGPHYVCLGHAEPVIRDEAKARRGKQSRNYGNRAELAVARKYGGEKIGHAGGPVDVRGAEFQTQVKTHRRPPPREWTTAFGKMAAARERCPRLLLRFVQGPGAAPLDYFVIPAVDWLNWFGRDE